MQEYTKEKIKTMKETTEKIVVLIKPANASASSAANSQENPAASHSQNENAIISFINLNNRNPGSNNLKIPKAQKLAHSNP